MTTPRETVLAVYPSAFAFQWAGGWKVYYYTERGHQGEMTRIALSGLWDHESSAWVEAAGLVTRDASNSCQHALRREGRSVTGSGETGL